MAIEQNISIAISTTSDAKLHLTNMNPKYKAYECDINSFKFVFNLKLLFGNEVHNYFHLFVRIEIGEGGPEWYKYFLCGVKGIIEQFSSTTFVGMKVAVSGNVPPASGLSSSSALVSAAALATSYANKVSLLCLEVSI